MRRRLGRLEMVCFAAGDIFAGGGSSLINVLYLIFLTDVVGLAPGLAGTAVLVAKIWDSINDPLTGALSDRTRTRWGRRRPWIITGGALLVIAMAVLWMPQPPVHGQVPLMLWVMGSYIVYNTIQTTIAVPYASLSTEITTDPDQRNKVNLLRLLFSTVSSASVTLLATMVLGQYRAGAISAGELRWTLVLGFGGFFAFVVLLAGLVSRERVPVPAEHPELHFFRDFLAPLRVPAMRRLLGMYLSQAIAYDIISAMVLYYAAYVVGVSSTVFLGVFIAVNLVAFPVVNALVKRHSKATIYRTLLPLALVAIVVVALYPSHWPVAGVYVAAAALASGMAGAQLLPWVMFPDVLDAAELQTKSRDAGRFGGLMTFTRGLATAVTIQVIGLVLQFTGYRPPPAGQATVEQGPAAVLGIRLVLLVGVAVLLVSAWLVSRGYPLTLARTREMKDELAEQRRELGAVSVEEPR